METKIYPKKKWDKKINLPPDKSITHRAFILASLTNGRSLIKNFSSCNDCKATLDCLRKIGVKFKIKNKDEIEFISQGKFIEPLNILNAENSATTIRLLSGILSAQKFLSIITGDSSLIKRPMLRIVSPLRLMGAEIQGRASGNYLPLVIFGRKLTPITYTLPISSAQVKSALLLAGVLTQGETILRGKILSRDHTERMLKALGAKIIITSKEIKVQKSTLKPFSLKIPLDISLASFFILLAILLPKSEIQISEVSLNPTRIEFLKVLKEMGANLEFKIDHYNELNEPEGEITAKSSNLKAIHIKKERIPFLIDEIPLLALASAKADGLSKIESIEELKYKESNRILGTMEILNKLGAKINFSNNFFEISGPAILKGNVLNPLGDHRLAMLAGIAASISKGESIIRNAESVNVSFPDFWKELCN